MVAVAQPRFDGLESPSGLLVVFIGDAVQGGGDGGVAVRAGRKGEAQERAVNSKDLTPVIRAVSRLSRNRRRACGDRRR